MGAIQDGGYKVFGGLGLQWVHWSPLPLPCLCSSTVQQLVSFHSGHLLSPLPHPHPHSQETQRGFIKQPLQRAGLVPHHGHLLVLIMWWPWGTLQLPPPL